MLKKTIALVYGAIVYFAFFGAFLYLIAFSENLLPQAARGSGSHMPVLAILADLGLILLFGLQHSVMARPSFKKWWTRFVPRHLERSTYVLASAVLITCIVRFWQPVEGDLWNVGGAAMVTLYAISALGWLMILLSSFLTDHFELFGLRQVYEYALGRPRHKPEFKERVFYKKMRHPMMFGFLIAFWAIPHMTVGNALFAGLMTAYILIGIYFEERDLLRAHGQRYREYCARVPKLLPVPRSKPAAETASVNQAQPEMKKRAPGIEGAA